MLPFNDDHPRNLGSCSTFDHVWRNTWKYNMHMKILNSKRSKILFVSLCAMVLYGRKIRRSTWSNRSVCPDFKRSLALLLQRKTLLLPMFFFGHLQVKWRLPPAIHISATAVPRSTDPFQPPKHPSQLDWTSLGQRTESRIRDHPSCSLPRKPGARRSLSNETMYHWQGIDDDHSYCIYIYVCDCVCQSYSYQVTIYIYILQNSHVFTTITHIIAVSLWLCSTLIVILWKMKYGSRRTLPIRLFHVLPGITCLNLTQ